MSPTSLRLSAIALSAILLAACASAPKGTLYEQFGGRPGLEALVEEFLARVLEDPRISDQFLDIDLVNLNDRLVEQFCVEIGGPCTYSGRSMAESHAALPVTEGIEQPLVLWVPSIAPTGLTVYTGDKIPAWKNNLFVGSARIGEIPRTGGLERVVLNDKLEEVRRERLLGSLHQRIRDVRQGPDGLVYIAVDNQFPGQPSNIIRLEPNPQ